MKFLILAVCVVAALARPDVSHLVNSARSDREATILKQTLDVHPEGTYRWEIETDNGINAHEHGEIKNANTDQAAAYIGGAFGYRGTDGQNYEVRYTADENGFHPEGAHLPTPPPIPEAIIRSLEFNAAHPESPQN